MVESSLPYRPCVGIMLLNHQNLVWIGRRIPKWEGDGSPYLWQMPQGGIDKGESAEEAAFRELEEETGATRASILERTRGWLRYDLPPEALGKAMKGRFRGQEQKWFAMRFEGDDADINIAPEKGEKPEFDSWRWEPMANLPDMVVPFKRDVYVQVVEAFRHLAE